MEKYINYKWVNSEVNEQQNSSTKNLARQVSYITGSHLIDHLNLFLWEKNMEKKEGLLKKKAKVEYFNSHFVPQTS